MRKIKPFFILQWNGGEKSPDVLSEAWKLVHDSILQIKIIRNRSIWSVFLHIK